MVQYGWMNRMLYHECTSHQEIGIKSNASIRLSAV